MLNDSAWKKKNSTPHHRRQEGETGVSIMPKYHATVWWKEFSKKMGMKSSNRSRAYKRKRNSAKDGMLDL